MKILVIGSGGREHALAWRLAQGKKVQKVYVAPGNAGTALEEGVENVNITAIPELLEFAKSNDIYMTVVGPEAPLAAGVVDVFRAAEHVPAIVEQCLALHLPSIWIQEGIVHDEAAEKARAKLEAMGLKPGAVVSR